MSKWTGLDEYSGSGRDVYVSQEGAHVVLSVEATSGSNTGSAMLTPAQACAIADELSKIATEANDYAAGEGSRGL